MKKGFTLIELLVVVLIIGILSAIALPQYQKAVEKSRSAEALTFVGNWIKAQQLYYLANNEFAGSFSKLDIELPGGNPYNPGDSALPTMRYFNTWMEDPVLYVERKSPTSIPYTLFINPDFTEGKFVFPKECYGDEQMCKSLGNDWSYGGTEAP